ncbi:MAG: sugar transferase [Culicoidibacterales bacterium]
MYQVFQRFVALIAVVILSPILVVVAIAIKLESKGPVLFQQERIGKDNINFQIYKFRSMYTETPNVPTHLLADPKAYITKVGNILRKPSLDELPQLWNIVKGEMVFVGPRPALYNQDDLKQLRTKKNVHTLVPGVTGWAQINGRDELEIPEKVKYDAEYLQKRSPFFDLKIMILTVVKVFKKDGVVEGKQEVSK